MCLYPRIIKNRKYEANKKNGGVIPAVNDGRTMFVPIGCGECMECKKKKQREWQARMQEDVKHNKNGKFVTLTFSNESIKKLVDEITAKIKTPYKPVEGYELDNEIATLATRKFLERWRKKFKKSLRHWFITELGHNGTENIHIHGIVWTDESRDIVAERWEYGYIWPRKDWKDNYVNEKTINYITKYVSKMDFDHKKYKSIILCSPGIGNGYMKRTDHINNKYEAGKTDESYRTNTGHKISLPIYWRNKIYSEEEREKLWIEKLDKEIRYVNGQEIDVKNGMEGYYKALTYARKKNSQLGYGNGVKDWTRETYERQRRLMMMEKRIDGKQRKGGSDST